jgi:hypothetical protein
MNIGSDNLLSYRIVNAYRPFPIRSFLPVGQIQWIPKSFFKFSRKLSNKI